MLGHPVHTCNVNVLYDIMRVCQLTRPREIIDGAAIIKNGVISP
jgi:hypothetical protein